MLRNENESMEPVDNLPAPACPLNCPARNYRFRKGLSYRAFFRYTCLLFLWEVMARWNKS